MHTTVSVVLRLLKSSFCFMILSSALMSPSFYALLFLYLIAVLISGARLLKFMSLLHRLLAV